MIHWKNIKSEGQSRAGALTAARHGAEEKMGRQGTWGDAAPRPPPA